MKNLFLAVPVVLFAACAAPPSPAPPPPAPQTFTDKELHALYYYDLGPDQIDVSAYPPGQQENYKLFARTCSQCHTLSRPINSPRESFVAWKYYVFTMRMRSKFKPGTGYTPEQGQAIVDFLTYDSMIRKDVHRADFEASTSRLDRRFREVITEQMRRLLQSMPIPHSER